MRDGNHLLIPPVSGLLEALQHYKKLDTNDYFVIGLWDGIWDGSDPAQYFVGSLQVSRLYNIYSSIYGHEYDLLSLDSCFAIDIS